MVYRQEISHIRINLLELLVWRLRSAGNCGSGCPRSRPWPGRKSVNERRVRYSPAPERTPLYGSPMAEEWRVSLVMGGGGSTVKRSRYRDLLRARLGDDVAVSAAKMHLFLYAGSAKAADEAGQVARAVLEEHGQFAEVRLERWDPSGGDGGSPMSRLNMKIARSQAACRRRRSHSSRGPVRPLRGVTSPRAGQRGRGRCATADIRRGPWPGRRGGWCRTRRARAGRVRRS